MDDFISRLLAGPANVKLSLEDLALLEAYLRQPVSFATIQQEKKATGHSPTEAARNKQKLIRDFNRGLQGQGEAGEAEKRGTAAPAVATARASRGVPLQEAEIKVRDWPSEHAEDNPAAITRDAVAEGAGVSPAQVSRTAAWKAFRERRDAEKKPRQREVSLTDNMLAVIPSNADRPDELAALIEEQQQEQAEEERRYKRRSKPF